MTISLYKIDTKTNVINKLEGATAVNIDITLYNDFNPASPTFYIDSLRNVNYCRFTFNGKIWVCSLSLVSFTDNIYVYSGSVDALATAWYNGCMNSEQLVQYSQNGNGNGYVMSDQRAISRNIADRIQYNLPRLTYGDDAYAVLTILIPRGDPDNIIELRPTSTAYNPTIETYWLSLKTPAGGSSPFDAFCSLFYNMKDADQVRFGASILSISVVPAEFYPTGAQNAQAVYLGSIATSAGGTGERVKSLKMPGYNVPVSGSHSVKRVLSVNTTGLTVTPENVNAKWILYLSSIGAITFSPGELGVAGLISSVGAELQIDFASNNISATLMINGTRYNHVFINATYSYSMPIFIDTSVTNWAGLVSSALLTVGSFVAGGVALATGVGTLAGIGAITAGVASAGNLGSQVYQTMTGSTSVSGGYGGNPDLSYDRRSALIIYDYPYIDLVGFQTLYGKPDGRRVNISLLSGYVQTLGARLPLKGLPYDIVQAAEGGLNAGAYII